MKKSKSKKKIARIIILCFIFLMIVGLWVFSVSIYKENFDNRFETYEPFMFYIDDFDGLERVGYDFDSNNGQKLKGYMYSSGENQRAIIVLAHGLGGGGHNSYMDCINYFAQNGYFVFAYDATGNDESEGEGVGGIPQGVIDLEYAINFVEESGNFPDLPIALFGHSWGGYSVCNVLTYHPEIKAVVECAGCDRSSDVLEAQGKKQAGDFIYAMMPFIKLHEQIKFGKYAANTAMDGFAASDATVMIVHGSDDGVVPAEYGYDMFYEKYKNDPRFSFLRLENRGHNFFNKQPAYIDEFNNSLDKWRETLDYDYKAEENKDRFAADKADYINQNLDREKYTNMLDTDLFDRFLKFYDDNI